MPEDTPTPPRTYTRTQACRILGIAPHTLIAWCRAAGIFPQPDAAFHPRSPDRREQRFTEEQLIELAALHGCDMDAANVQDACNKVEVPQPPPRRATKANTPPADAERVLALEAEVTRLRARVKELDEALGERQARRERLATLSTFNDGVKDAPVAPILYTPPPATVRKKHDTPLQSGQREVLIPHDWVPFFVLVNEHKVHQTTLLRAINEGLIPDYRRPPADEVWFHLDEQGRKRGRRLVGAYAPEDYTAVVAYARVAWPDKFKPAVVSPHSP